MPTAARGFLFSAPVVTARQVYPVERLEMVPLRKKSSARGESL